MAIWRLSFHLELDPSTPGITGFHNRVQDRLANAITIARTNEKTTYSSIIVTGGRPADRRIWYGGDKGPGSIGQLIFPTEQYALELVSDLFTMTDSPPTFRWPNAILPAPPDDPTVLHSFVVYHVCDHDLENPTLCTPNAEWSEP